MMKIDFHTHLGLGTGEPRAEDLIAMLDEYGISRAVTFPAVSGLTGSPRQIGAANDYVAQAMRRYPDRITGFCTVNPYHEDEAIAELERAAGLGLRGLKLHPPLQGFVLTDRKLLDPVLRVVQQLGFPIVVHCGLRVSGLPYVLVNLSDLKLLAEAYPEVKFIVAHLGWGGRDSKGVDELARENANVWFDTSGVNSPDLIRQVVDGGAARRVLYGSDFPFLHPKVELLRIELAALAPQVESAVLGDNAASLLMGLTNAA